MEADSAITHREAERTTTRRAFDHRSAQWDLIGTQLGGGSCMNPETAT